MASSVRAAFIDRDGVINEERNYVYKIQDFVLLPGVLEALKIFQDNGFLLIVVTNQAGIARGYYDSKAVEELHFYMRSLFSDSGIMIDKIYYCPHHREGIVKKYAIDCNCRKPAPGMLIQAVNEFNIDTAQSVLIGDKISDIQAGRRAGVGCNVLVESGHPFETSTRFLADYVVADLLAAAQLFSMRS